MFEIRLHTSVRVRAMAALLCTGLTLRYICWRISSTLPPQQNELQRLWSRSFLVAELATLISSMLIYFFLSRTINRSDEATAFENSAHHDQPTDVFIATYNEPRDILERTIIGTLAIEHADLRIWLLDDGNRPWARELADSLGVQYISREKGKHAKAGNINNGVQQALESDRVPSFFLILDADFVPHRSILRRTLGLFHVPTVGIVQTPQHFFNPDPIQTNLFCDSVWPDEQRFFFNCLMPAKDAWGAAFCCGTSAVFRTEAFVKAGGMAVETVTEDMLTSFKFMEHGYRTIFLNERLSLGLAPESLVEYISQRSRWCLGAVQQLFTRWSFAGSGRVSLINRLAFFDTVLYWFSCSSFKLMIIIAPLLYWFTGTSTIHASTADMIEHLCPMILANYLFMYYITDNKVFPVMTDVSQLLSSIVILRTIVTGLVHPFGRAFKVTAKGLSSSGVVVQWKLLWPFAAFSGATAFAVLCHITRFSPAHGTYGYSGNILFSLMNIALLAITALACVEPPRRRRDERFKSIEPATLVLSAIAEREGDVSAESRSRVACVLRDISLGGASLQSPAEWKTLAGAAKLEVFSALDSRILELPVTFIGSDSEVVRLKFAEAPWIRHALTRKLFTGDYHREVNQIVAYRVIASLTRALIS